MNMRATMSTKGQVVVPKAVREARGWAPGTELEFIERDGDVVVQAVKRPDPRFPRITWAEFEKHRIKYSGPPVTVEDMHKAVLDEAKRRWDAKNH